MSESDLVVVFDLLDSGYKDWWFPAVGLVMVAIGFLLIRFPRRIMEFFNQTSSPRLYNIFSRVYFGLSVFWVVFAFATTYGSYYSLSSAYVDGNFKTVEGLVENFRRNYSPPIFSAGLRASSQGGGDGLEGVLTADLCSVGHGSDCAVALGGPHGTEAVGVFALDDGGAQGAL